MCDLVSRLTRGRGAELKGVVQHPQRQAARLRNFGKALEVLREAPKPLKSK